MYKIGNGFDVHRLVPGRALILGGVTIPFELGLEGFSDADCLTHAIIDALLGAAGLGDIGMWFPEVDPRFAGANSLELLRLTCEELAKQKLRVGNIDATIICERPKLSPFFSSMRKELSLVLKISEQAINVKATTTEKLGSIGEGLAIAALACCLLVPVP